jgi:hypothetical protein|tara:strand:+ start:1369 stop:1491 length:123 start_codon:yes stop_codon:yes gene_type:complete
MNTVLRDFPKKNEILLSLKWYARNDRERILQAKQWKIITG